MIKRVNQIMFLKIILLLFGLTIISCQNTATTKKSSYSAVIQDTELSKSIVRGEVIYKDFCIQCHLPDGKGTPKIYPPLAGSDWLTNKREESIHSLKYGLNGPIKVNGQLYNSSMASLGLEDGEIADVMNHIMNSWGNTQEKMVTEEEVKAIIK